MLAAGFLLSSNLMDAYGVSTRLDGPDPFNYHEQIRDCASCVKSLFEPMTEIFKSQEKTEEAQSSEEGDRCRHCEHTATFCKPDDMGNICCPCCKSCTDYNPVRGSDDSDEDERSAFFQGKGRHRGKSPDFSWEQHVLDENIMKSGRVSYSAIVSFSDGQLKASAPRGFVPDKSAVKTILDALKGDTSGIANGISLGAGSKTSMPGKMDAGKAIYGSDGHGGGCTIYKTKVNVLIVMYDQDPATATRLASEVAEYMEEQGR